MDDYLNLHDGGQLPAIGFGTWKLQGDDASNAVSQALEAGYRLIDTAAIYGNEKPVGEAIVSSGIDRDDIFVTTKLWNDDQGYDSAIEALDLSLDKLGLDYVDLYLIHWPDSSTHHEAWKAMIDIQKSGKAIHIGVSNFTVQHLKDLIAKSGVQPAVNQIEFHPGIYDEQKDILEFCQDQEIVVEAYSPLAQASLLEDETVEEIADKLDKTPAQVLLKWAMQHDTVPLPKSGTIERIYSNFDVFDFDLDSEDMESLNSISSGDRVTHDPHSHD